MEGEFNNLTANNTPITFTGKTDNIATSDELTASPIYQDKMGTKYSKGKAVSKSVTAAGITLIMTAAAIKTGSLISNAYVLNPPSISKTNFICENHVFSYSFTVTNKRGYAVSYHLLVNEEEVLNEDCTEEKEYVGTYDKLSSGDNCKFYIAFTNKVDYKQMITHYDFIVED